MPKLTVGTLVWAKMKGYPAWPGKVVYPPTGLKAKKNNHYVFFFGSENYAWVPDNNIYPYAENVRKFSNKYKSASFRKAVDAIAKLADEYSCSDSDDCENKEDTFEKEVPKITKRLLVICTPYVPKEIEIEKTYSKDKETDDAKQSNVQKDSSEYVSSPSEHEKSDERVVKVAEEQINKQQKELIEVNLKNMKRKRKMTVDVELLEESDTQLASEDGIVKKQVPSKRKSSSSEENPDHVEKESRGPLVSIKVESDNELIDSELHIERPVILAERPGLILFEPKNVIFASDIASSQCSDSVSCQSSTSQQRSADKLSEHFSVPINANISEEKSHTMELYHKSHLVSTNDIRIPVVVVSKRDQEICAQKMEEFTGEIPRTKVIQTNKCIGFIGVGKGIVKNLLLTGHRVNLWNCDTQMCNDFVRQGAVAFNTPADVAKSSDITILCVSDEKTVDDVIYSNTGFFYGCPFAKGRKGLINMTYINPEKSTELAETMSYKRIKYLDVQIIEDSERLAEEGKLLLVCSGNISLYNECASLFYAISGKSKPLFIGNKPSNAATMQIIYTSFAGSVYMGYQEMLACIEKLKLNKELVMEALNHTPLYGSELSLVACAIGNKIANPNCSLDPSLTHIKNAMSMTLHLAGQRDQPMLAVSAANEGNMLLLKFELCIEDKMENRMWYMDRISAYDS